MDRKTVDEKEQSQRLAMACQQTVVTVEICEKTTKFEVDCWRLAHSKAVSEAEAAAAAVMYFRSVRQRNSRYQVRELGLPKTSILKQFDKSQDYNAAF
jgi:hypothetical protein